VRTAVRRITAAPTEQVTTGGRDAAIANAPIRSLRNGRIGTAPNDRLRVHRSGSAQTRVTGVAIDAGRPRVPYRQVFHASDDVEIVEVPLTLEQSSWLSWRNRAGGSSEARRRELPSDQLGSSSCAVSMGPVRTPRPRGARRLAAGRVNLLTSEHVDREIAGDPRAKGADGCQWLGAGSG